jgi:hypothetical protein
MNLNREETSKCRVFMPEMGLGEDYTLPWFDDSLPNRPNSNSLQTKFSRGSRPHAPRLEVGHVSSG